MTNCYTLTALGRCPVDDRQDSYTVEVVSPKMVECQFLATAVRELFGRQPAFQEDLTQQLADLLRCRVRTTQVHMGRCNTKRRIRIAWEIGVDTIDGTGFSRWGDRRILNGVRWIKQCQAQGLLRELDRLGPVHEWLGG